ncbi:hypothetical protein [Flavobacterium sp.]|jgi:hypothetical protein|uniref:hypothetical protein n=1 Tax=Flavobacterium sp. TaxID=239 RepID=UPI003753224C
MIIWRGKGILVLFIFGIITYICYLLFEENPNGSVIKSKALAPAFLLTGIICFFLAKGWKASEGKVYYDPKKNKEVTVRPDHSIFYINVFYWSFILIALGVLSFYKIWK